MKLLMTLAEDVNKTTLDNFGVIYSVDEEDCFEFADAFGRKGFDVYFVNWDDFDGHEFTRMFHSCQRRFGEPVALDRFDLIFPYKMESFLQEPDRFDAMIRRFERTSALIINHPDTIRHNLSKAYLWQLQELGVRIVPTYPINDDLNGWLKRYGKLIAKPKVGERGSDHRVIHSEWQLEGIKDLRDSHIAQAFMPCVRHGEVSMFFLGLQFQASVIKHPNPKNPNEYKCNESVGGTVAIYDPTSAELEFGLKVLKSYQVLGYETHFSRIDIIRDEGDPLLMEAELVNPSIYANYTGRGAIISEQVADYFKTQLDSHNGRYDRTVSPIHSIQDV